MRLEFHQLDGRGEHLRVGHAARRRRLLASSATSGQPLPLGGAEPQSALEQGWLLAEMEQRFGYGLEELAQRFDRSVSWVSRRLALVELLPEAIQQLVREGKVPAQVAMKYLVPVARISLDDCQRMADRKSVV